jgi:anti-repressor protein
VNEIMTFNNEELGRVREITIDDEYWFCGKDICFIFGDKNHNRTLGRIDPEDKQIIKITDSMGRKQDAIFINESGLYTCLFAMQPQKAHNYGVSDEYPIEVQQRIDKLHKFKRWVTHEVIPSIRKTGSYSTNKNEQGINDHLIEIVNLQQDEINRLKKTHRDAAFAHPFQISALHHVLRDNGYNINHVKLCKRLRDEGYLEYYSANGRNYNVPTTKSLDLGIMYEDQSVYQGSFVIPVTYITVKGQKYFIDLYCTPHEVIATDMKPMQFCRDLHNCGYSKRPLELMQWMRDNGYLKREGHVNIATEKSLKMGLMKDNVTRSGNYENHHTIVTGEGQKFFKILLM